MGSSRTVLVLEDTSRTKFGGLGLGLDAVLLRLGVLVSVAGIYANVIRTIAKIHLVPTT